MNISKVLKDFRRQLQLIQEAIYVLEQLLAESGGPRRGRPPKWLSGLKRKEEKRRRPRKKPPTRAAQIPDAADTSRAG